MYLPAQQYCVLKIEHLYTNLQTLRKLHIWGAKQQQQQLELYKEHNKNRIFYAVSCDGNKKGKGLPE